MKGGMIMVKKAIGVISMLLFVTGWGWAASPDGYNYIAPDALQKRITGGSPMILIDICPVDQFAAGHIKGSIETNAYPVKTDAEKARLANYLPKIKAASEDVIIVCPGGGSGARNTFDFYKSNGVEEKRLLILEKGMGKWPYEKEKK
jgi:rhodanese-related sulfurtransferase